MGVNMLLGQVRKQQLTEIQKHRMKTEASNKSWLRQTCNKGARLEAGKYTHDKIQQVYTKVKTTKNM